MNNTEGMQCRLTRFANKEAARLGFLPAEVYEAFYRPTAVYSNGLRAGQFRIAGKRVVLVGAPTDVGDKFVVFTLFENGSKTPVGTR